MSNHTNAFSATKQVYWLLLGAASGAHRDLGIVRDLNVAFIGNIDRAHRKTPGARHSRLLSVRCRTDYFDVQASPLKLTHIHSRAKIVFNTSITGDSAMRLFVGTICGAQMLTDPVAPENGSNHLFAEDEIAIYRDDAELLARIEYIGAHPDERERMAQAGQKRTLAQHTYERRASTMLTDVRRCAPMRSALPSQRLHERVRVYTHLHMPDAILDATRGRNPLHRMWIAAPCLARGVVL